MISTQIKNLISYSKEIKTKKEIMKKYKWLFKLEFNKVKKKQFKEEGKYINNEIIRNFYVEGKSYEQVSLEQLKKRNESLEYQLLPETDKKELEKYVKELVDSEKITELNYCEENEELLNTLKEKKNISKDYREIYEEITKKLNEIEKEIEESDENQLDQEEISELLDLLEQELFV